MPLSCFLPWKKKKKHGPRAAVGVGRHNTVHLISLAFSTIILNSIVLHD